MGNDTDDVEWVEKSRHYQCRSANGAGEQSETMEGVLCKQFGISQISNWYFEGLSEGQIQDYEKWDAELLEMEHGRKQFDWCDETAVDAWRKYEVEFIQMNKARDIVPTHALNMSSTAVSMCCMLIWLCLSPHQKQQIAESLDLTCMLASMKSLLQNAYRLTQLFAVGSFYAMQFVGNVLVAVVNCLYSCVNERAYTFLLFLYFGVSVIGTNILCHRYNFIHSLYNSPLFYIKIFSQISSRESQNSDESVSSPTIPFI